MEFKDIVLEHLEWIARLAYQYYNDKYEAEDLAQETLMRILDNADRFDRSLPFKPWAKTIMTNIFKTQCTRRAKVMFAPLDEYMGYRSGDCADSRAITHNYYVVINDVAADVVGVECVMLYAQGYGYDEIASRVHIGTGTVKSRIHAGRKALRRALCD